MPRLNHEERGKLTRPITTKEIESSKVSQQDFPGGPVAKNLPANAGGHGFDPWSRGIPHTSGQLSLHATATEPEGSRARGPQEKPPQ